MSLIILFQVLLFLVGAFSFGTAIQKGKKGGFYTDTAGLLPLGIFVWGDALILGPFWMIAALLFTFLSPLEILRFFLIFFLVRALYEVVYWITHQVVKREYRPPLFRRIQWLQANEAAILYQLLNMCQVILCAFALLITYR